MIFAGAVAPARAQTYKQIYSFPGGRHGSQPYGSLVEFRGRLFGTTARGGLHNGRNGYGTVFALDPTTGKKTTIYIFQGGNNGANPYGSLTLVGNVLYGTTSNGGAANAGTVFSVDPKSHAENIVHTFQGGNDGSNPSAALLYVAGTLYGVTSGGGAGSAGTVFSIDTATGVEKIVYAFRGNTDGYQPYAGLIEVDGMLYGTTAYGGASGDGGTVFAFDIVTNTETILYAFQGGSDGQFPQSSSLTDVGGTLYGSTPSGGTAGTVFEITP